MRLGGVKRILRRCGKSDAVAMRDVEAADALQGCGLPLCLGIQPVSVCHGLKNGAVAPLFVVRDYLAAAGALKP